MGVTGSITEIQLLLADELVHAGWGYCLALARFGTPADADVLVTYLTCQPARRSPATAACGHSVRCAPWTEPSVPPMRPVS
ncbi:DUF6000 family protein [Nocardia otitidiscaviarum]|uniref:DUF6000 family protein n=1 Tax=Nocardia otitidiscaviarum TaxID=1823 RepID=UPI001C8F7E09